MVAYVPVAYVPLPVAAVQSGPSAVVRVQVDEEVVVVGGRMVVVGGRMVVVEDVRRVVCEDVELPKSAVMLCEAAGMVNVQELVEHELPEGWPVNPASVAPDIPALSTSTVSPTFMPDRLIGPGLP